MTHVPGRKHWALALALLTVGCTGLGIVGYLRAAPAAADRFYLRNDGGAVLFEHARHGSQSGGCVNCHHELAVAVSSCDDCHDPGEYSPAFADHEELLTLHERNCAGCHEIAPAEEAVSCRECHAEDLSAVYHRSCNACHLATAAQRFAGQAGEPLCRSCHLR